MVKITITLKHIFPSLRIPGNSAIPFSYDWFWGCLQFCFSCSLSLWCGWSEKGKSRLLFAKRPQEERSGHPAGLVRLSSRAPYPLCVKKWHHHSLGWIMTAGTTDSWYWFEFPASWSFLPLNWIGVSFGEDSLDGQQIYFNTSCLYPN